MFKFLDAVPSWVWAAAVIALGLLSGSLVLSKSLIEVELANSHTELADVRLAHEKAARARAEALREIERIRTQAKEKVDEAVFAERTRTQAAVDDARAARDELRDATLELARHRERSSDPAAVARAEARAQAFGELLVQCDRVSESLGREAEDLATQVRGLQQQYQSLVLSLTSGPPADSP